MSAPPDRHVLRVLLESDQLDFDWYRGVAGLDLDSDELVAAHYLKHELPSGHGPNAMLDRLLRSEDASSAMPAVRQAIESAGAFDPDFYLKTNPDVARSRVDPLLHFCKHGWKEFRNPSMDFDVWWYLAAHLPASGHSVNPLLHHVVLGKHLDLDPAPPNRIIGDGMRYASGISPRRICLFAGYDPDGVVDDCVVRYVRELSRHAEVYYLADCALGEGELEKLSPFVKGSWAFRHGEYDFGSWSRLARELVGWETIDGYDELVLANDSCYLLRELDEVFAKMDATACDWWGMQAAKRDFDEAAAADGFPLVADAQRTCVGSGAHRHLDSLHVSSYFIVYRRPVLLEQKFRSMLDSVAIQADKSQVILRYEIGISRLLGALGYVLQTFVEHLLPYHPVYTARQFDLIGQGFPLLKRTLLSHNPLGIDGLGSWKTRLRELVPTADVAEMERNLLRVSDDEKLRRSLGVVKATDGRSLARRVLTDAQMHQADAQTPKHGHWWAFPVCAYDHLLTGNERAVFEEVRDDPSIKKIILTRGKRIELTGENVVVFPLGSPEGQYHLLRAKQIFVKHSPQINARYALSPKLHNFVNLWHGIPLKRFGPASLDMQSKLDWVYRENRSCRAVISSSKIDAMAMAAAFYPLPYRDVWVTGLPRNDFIVRAEAALPADFREEGRRLGEALAGRRLVLFAPTFKNAQADGYYPFSEEEIGQLRDWLMSNNAVLGVREHMADSAHAYSARLAPLGIMDLSSRRYPNIEVLYRQAWMLLTDYSSCAIDFMLTERLAISFAYDLDRYENEERGLFYDLEHVFPGPVCRDFEQMMRALVDNSNTMSQADAAAATWRKKVFFDHDDDHNARRVSNRVRALHAN